MALILSTDVGRALTPDEIDSNNQFLLQQANTQKNQADSSATAAGTSAAQALSAAGTSAATAAAQAVSNAIGAIGTSQAAAAQSASAAAASATAIGTQAGVATAQAAAAAAAATAASQSAAVTTQQAGVAVAAQLIYATTAAGLAAIAQGKYFFTPSATTNGTLDLYLNNGGVAQFIVTLPNLAALPLTTLAGYAFTFLDGAGNAAGGIMNDGTWNVAKAVLQALAVKNLSIADGFPGYAHVLADGTGAFSVGVRDDGIFETAKAVVTTLNGRPVDRLITGADFPHFGSSYAVFQNGGQSNGASGQGTPGITTAQPFDCVGFPPNATTGLASFLPMTSANCAQALTGGGTGEIPMFGALNYLKQIIQSRHGISYTQQKFIPVCLNNAQGGQSIAQLGPGTPNFIAWQTQLQAAYTIAQAQGATIKDAGESWPQGEADYQNSQDYYREQLIGYGVAKDAIARSITGQDETRMMFLYQMNSWGPDYVKSVALAQLQATDVRPDMFVMAAPSYWWNFGSDIQHGDSISRNVWGAYVGLAINQVCLLKRPFQPLRPMRWNLQGTVLRVQFNRSGLVLDTTYPTVPAAPQYGMNCLTPGGSEIAINSATVVDPTTVEFALASVPPEGSVFWMGGKGVATGLKGNYIGSLINLRDSQGNTVTYTPPGSSTPVPMHNWCVVNKIPLIRNSAGQFAGRIAGAIPQPNA